MNGEGSRFPLPQKVLLSSEAAKAGEHLRLQRMHSGQKRRRRGPQQAQAQAQRERLLSRHSLVLEQQPQRETKDRAKIGPRLEQTARQPRQSCELLSTNR